jgi:hypothetical protein
MSEPAVTNNTIDTEDTTKVDAAKVATEDTTKVDAAKVDAANTSVLPDSVPVSNSSVETSTQAGIVKSTISDTTGIPDKGVEAKSFGGRRRRQRKSGGKKSRRVHRKSRRQSRRRTRRH